MQHPRCSFSSPAARQSVRTVPRASASDWQQQPGYYPSPDWSTAPGVYADPRTAPPGHRRQPRSGTPADDVPSTSFDREDGAQEADPLSDVARAAVDAVVGCLAFLVGSLSDAALSLLPAHAKRRAVENSVKGALALLGLALLQSVLSFVLTVGTLVLVVYAAHQVFGVQLPFLPTRGAGGGGGMGQPGPGPGSAGQYDPRLFGYGSTYGGAQPEQGGGYYGNAPYRGQPPYPPRPGAGARSSAGPIGGRRQGPTIDVWFEEQQERAGH
ncbi:hypothetical protein TSOC_003745 [Tetrabaena socialis]|uniref:Uncharacterized protein n=1 Tax=Tetrabaena socialis TaxID=47790 RepID=A0A2J8AAS1_9CHLO|nr:hypothetical protein TSOC_003745 [Tetrabaena socialis]|eukprot:PNH09618.1 hypothetical protein TSOC_003745 [Tetrabaena socialis]